MEAEGAENQLLSVAQLAVKLLLSVGSSTHVVSMLQRHLVNRMQCPTSIGTSRQSARRYSCRHRSTLGATLQLTWLWTAWCNARRLAVKQFGSVPRHAVLEEFKHGQHFHPLRVFFRESWSYLGMELLESETCAKLYRAKGLGRMW